LWYGAAVIGVYAVAVGLFLLARPGPLSHFQNIDNLTQILGPLLLAPLCAMAVRPQCRRVPNGERGGQRDLRRWAPLFLVLGATTDTIAASIEFYYSAFVRQPIPVPSWADAAYFSTYLLWLVAIVLLPVRPRAREVRLRTLVDGLMLMTAVVTFNWYFVLGPTVLQSSQGYLSNAVAAGYPLGDLLLVLCLVLLMVRDGTPALRPVARLLALAFTCTIFADSVYAFQMLKGVYATGEVIDMGWPLSDMLAVLAAYVLHRSLSREERSASAAQGQMDGHYASPAWQGLLPYLFVPLVGLLVIYISYDRGAPALKTGAYLCGGVLIGLVITRQVLAILENSRLNRGLNEALAQSAAFAAELQGVNEKLMSAQEELRQNNQALVGANERLHALASTDPLTLLPNHRSTVSLLDQEIERARRYGHSCSVLFIDLDHFKALNDSYGHASGDDALRDLALLLQATVRTMDTVGRWGGEEFVVLLPETDNAAAMGLAERLRDAVAHHFFTVGGGTQLTCSIGIATYPEDEIQRTKLVSAADKAMYVAKFLGRNQVRSAGEPAVAMLDFAYMHADPRQDAALMGTVDALVALLGARPIDRSAQPAGGPVDLAPCPGHGPRGRRGAYAGAGRSPARRGHRDYPRYRAT
jgi:diguanylate cyclase (GGDEF)-like protein